jgi:hypothetical protein
MTKPIRTKKNRIEKTNQLLHLQAAWRKSKSCKGLERGEEMHHANDMQTTATMEAQHEMATAMIYAAKVMREASRVKRQFAQPKREASLEAARATRQRIAEVRKAKSIIRITRSAT